MSMLRMSDMWIMQISSVRPIVRFVFHMQIRETSRTPSLSLSPFPFPFFLIVILFMLFVGISQIIRAEHTKWDRNFYAAH